MKIIFCTLYKWISSMHIDDIPQYTVMSLLSILITLNIVTVLHIIRYLLGFRYISYSTWPFGVLAALLMFVIYWFYIRDEYYLKMFREFQRSGKKGGMMTAAYIVLSISSLIIAAGFLK